MSKNGASGLPEAGSTFSETFSPLVGSNRPSTGCGGGKRARTADPLLAKQVLSQLSYTPGPSPIAAMVGLGGFEPPTSRLSGVRSNQLSYRPGDYARDRPTVTR